MAEQMDRRLLLKSHSKHRGEWLHVGTTVATPSGSSAGVTVVTDPVPVLQRGSGTRQNRLERRLDRIRRRLLGLGDGVNGGGKQGWHSGHHRQSTGLGETEWCNIR